LFSQPLNQPYNPLMLRYKRIGLTVKSGLDDKCESVHAIVALLEQSGAQVFMDPRRAGGIECATHLPSYASESDIDLLLVLGGDGTILRAVRELHQCSVPVLSINRGTVGFLSELEFSEMETELPKILGGEGLIDERSVLNVVAYRGKEELLSGIALNEAVIAQGTIARLVDLKTVVNGEPLTTFHADGLIVSTPTGSTAYNLSAGGPIVHPTLRATILTPINPHSFSQKPVVIRSDAVVDIEVQTKGNKYGDSDVNLTLDGQVYVQLKRGDTVRIVNDERCIRFLRKKQDTFFATLRSKLKWGERVE